jgi:hypothetical protein
MGAASVVLTLDSFTGFTCRRQQEELERRMKAMDKEDLEFEEQVGSLKEQAEQYTKKLKKLYASYQTKKSEREGLRKEFQVHVFHSLVLVEGRCSVPNPNVPLAQKDMTSTPHQPFTCVLSCPSTDFCIALC